MTNVLKLQWQAPAEIGDDTPFSATSVHHCGPNDDDQ